MTDKPWKRLERDVAKALDTERVLKKGTNVPDVIAHGYAIDCKKRKNLNAWQAYQDCKRYSEYGKPVVVWAKPGVGLRGAIVIMGWEDWRDSHD